MSRRGQGSSQKRGGAQRDLGLREARARGSRCPCRDVSLQRTRAFLNRGIEREIYASMQEDHNLAGSKSLSSKINILSKNMMQEGDADQTSNGMISLAEEPVLPPLRPIASASHVSSLQIPPTSGPPKPPSPPQTWRSMSSCAVRPLPEPLRQASRSAARDGSARHAGGTGILYMMERYICCTII